MLLIEDHLKLEPADFEYLRSSWDTHLQKSSNLGDGVSFDDYAKMNAETCTERINQKLSSLWSGSRSTNTQTLGKEVFAYLWKMGTSPGQIKFDDYIRLDQIKNHFGYKRHPDPGRPIADERKKPPHREMTLTRVLNQLEKAGLVESNRPNKRKTYYRISQNTLGEIITFDERTRRFTQLFWKQSAELDFCKRRNLAILWYLNKLGIQCSEEDIMTEWTNRARGGQAVPVEIIGPVPLFKSEHDGLRFNPP